ncbi:YggS family pyridoxal phosphate-dependent enzyme [Alkalihalobacterium chitinilyticum]|uniref:Pyridoxal phosphate homeostasis protein n=1 Tax=Alkalihalobacterium chitinilyticum TaxID=2980103 RepID=A0ABT5VC64_9BACI|nr:YggS family pyridoxal phosphate-dependent enzyme [Alkalihalobacterium chitinilyticum]MDE5413046.1 YggS family pyridoxal phosphate-dependent enzyme [Alkalihalobacterium chitinilyticum]
MTVKDNLHKIQEEINAACQRSGRNSKDVKIIAVTKYVTVERTQEALDAGIIHIGENRSEGLIEKAQSVDIEPILHFIGSLQSKKVKNVVEHISYLHSLDRLSLAQEIQKRWQSPEPLKCFVQVNVSGEESKSGLKPNETIPFIQELAQFPAVQVVGLMTMAPFVENSEDTRPVFKKLRLLQQEVQALSLDHAPCTELSMGMSNDYIIAVEEGATFIRIGSSLVG